GFVAERCFVHPSAKAPPTALYDAYCSWSGDKLMTQRAFGDRLEDMGFTRDRTKSGRFCSGLGLHTDGHGDTGDAISESFPRTRARRDWEVASPCVTGPAAQPGRRQIAGVTNERSERVHRLAPDARHALAAD